MILESPQNLVSDAHCLLTAINRVFFLKPCVGAKGCSDSWWHFHRRLRLANLAHALRAPLRALCCLRARGGPQDLQPLLRSRGVGRGACAQAPRPCGDPVATRAWRCLPSRSAHPQAGPSREGLLRLGFPVGAATQRVGRTESPAAVSCSPVGAEPGQGGESTRARWPLAPGNQVGWQVALGAEGAGGAPSSSRWGWART